VGRKRSFHHVALGFPVAPKRSERGFVHYDNRQTAEVSWSFIRELPPKNSKK
jgi:hypothetical protein